MTFTLYNHFAKGVKNNSSGTQMTWWKTHFNMPVPNLLDDTSNWVRGQGPFEYKGEATSFDFTGFDYGWEAIIGVSIIDAENEPETNITIIQEWDSGFTVTTDSILYDTTDDGVWNEALILSNQGLAPWEINDSHNGGTLGYDVTVINRDTGDTIASGRYEFDVSNVPTFPGYKSSGYMWCEDNSGYLKYIDANGFEHTILGDYVDDNHQPGFMWIYQNQLHYTGANGDHFKVPFPIKQFASTFSNGAPGEVKDKKPGFIYCDNEFGWTHISFIGDDGYKYLTGNGHYPYTDPY